MNEIVDVANTIQTYQTLLSTLATATEIIKSLKEQVILQQRRIDYYEGKTANWIEDTLTKGMHHRFDSNGRCIRCGTDAEEWEQGCVEEMAKELEQVRAELAKYKGAANDAQ